MSTPDAAIVLAGVAKHFRKTKTRREYTTFKTELLRVLKGERTVGEKLEFIEALKHVDLVVPKGKTVGIIGRNGSGKSTLLKLITGIYGPSSGTVKVNGRISALLDLGAGFHPDFSGRENILINGIILGMTRGQVKARMQEIIDFAELGEFIDEPVRTYSSGMFMRLAFAVATHVDPDILIIDEILAVGDEHFGRKSMKRMKDFKQSGKTIVLVTHDLGTVKSWCDHAVWIDGGRVREEGEPGQVVERYRAAVTAAEEGPAETSALRAPGIELPAVAAVPQSTVQLTELKVLPVSGRLELQVSFKVSSSTSFELVAQISDSHGRVLFASTLPASVQSSGQARARLTVEHQAFAPGKYQVLVQAFPPAPQPVQELRADLELNASQGVAKSSHPDWTLEPPSA
ncbi:MAG: ABC transporter ATP-binding protein [Archangiaceae bacterium]|nr:ABC transporter ATP-binding protein [Archangiaceae bacterium]